MNVADVTSPSLTIGVLEFYMPFQRPLCFSPEVRILSDESSYTLLDNNVSFVLCALYNTHVFILIASIIFFMSSDLEKPLSVPTSRLLRRIMHESVVGTTKLCRGVESGRKWLLS